MTSKSELDELRSKVNALESQLPPTMPSEAEIAAAKNAAHQLAEGRASQFNWADRDQLAAMRAACPDNLARDIVHDNRASPTVPRSIIPSSSRPASNIRGANVPGNETGWQAPTPTRPPPGIDYVDAQLDAQDRRDRADLIRAEAIRRAAELKTKGR